MVEVEAPCAVCGKLTRHRGDNAGALHCVTCALSNSIPPTSDVTPDGTPIVPMPEDAPRRRSTVEIIAAIVTVAILGFLVYAFIRGV